MQREAVQQPNETLTISVRRTYFQYLQLNLSVAACLFRGKVSSSRSMKTKFSNLAKKNEAKNRLRGATWGDTGSRDMDLTSAQMHISCL